MSLEILRDPRVRGVQWKDLVSVTRWETVAELTISLPWLALSLWLANMELYLLALPVSFVFFLTGLRQVHNAYHYAIGISRAATQWVMFVLSILMLGSMHAVQYNHLHHHKHCMSDNDWEAVSARMKWYQALLFGPLFPLLLHWKALQHGNARQRTWIGAELLANAVWIGLVFFVLPFPFLKYHVIVMAIGQCFTAFFAVWTVHHDCDRSHFIARTLRSRFKNLISFDMFFHVEHHLYPSVPTCHLRQLSERLDEAAPELQEKQVF